MIEPDTKYPDYSSLPRRMIITSSHREKKINSYGILAYAKDTKRWLLVQCNYSPGMNYILYGAYRPVYLESLLLNLNQEELSIIKSIVGPDDPEEGLERFESYYEKELGKPLKTRYPFDRLMDLKKEIMGFGGETESQNPETTPFGVPKGRAKYKEEPLTAAIREFAEETGLEIETPSHNESVYVENPGLTGKRYRIKCWIHVFEEEPDLSAYKEFDTMEIKSREWVTIEDDDLPNSFILSTYPTAKTKTGKSIYLDYESVMLIKQAITIVKS